MQPSPSSSSTSTSSPGPFDLLLTLVLREEVDLLEVDLADVVLAYLDHLEARGELDLEAATEFLVLIAALLELKSRLMLPREEEEELDLEPGEAAEELLARMLEYHRYRGAGGHLRERLAAEDGPPLPRGAAAARAAPASPVDARRRRLRARTRSAPRSARCCASRRRSTLRHLAAPRVSVAERLAHLRGLLRRGPRSRSTRRWPAPTA